MNKKACGNVLRISRKSFNTSPGSSDSSNTGYRSSFNSKMAFAFTKIVGFENANFVYYTAITLWCRYIDYISAASHRSIAAFQVKINLTFMWHRNAVSSHECAVRKRSAIAVYYERTFIHNKRVSFICPYVSYAHLYCLVVWIWQVASPSTQHVEYVNNYLSFFLIFLNVKSTWYIFSYYFPIIMSK